MSTRPAGLGRAPTDPAVNRGTRGPVRGVLLDFGGTLDSDGVHWSTQYARAFEQAGIRVERAVLDRAFVASEAAFEAQDPAALAPLDLAGHVGWQIRHMLAGLAAVGVELSPHCVEPSSPGGQTGDHPHTSHSGVALAARLTDLATAPMRRALEAARLALGALRPPLRLGLVSNFTPNLPGILRETGLAPRFDAVVVSTLEGTKKPDPAMFRRALDRMGVAAGQAVMVGDSLPADIVPAHALGLRTVWIRGDQVFGRGDPAAADHQVPTLARALHTVADMAGIRGTPSAGGEHV